MITTSTQPLVQQALEKIRNRTACVGVVGLGYVGLPFLVEKTKVGFRVVGIDHNPQRAEMVASGKSHISDVKDDDLHEGLRLGLISTTTSLEAVRELDV